VPEPRCCFLAHPHRLEPVREPTGQLVAFCDARDAAMNGLALAVEAVDVRERLTGDSITTSA
jgi:hypothetical protein